MERLLLYHLTAVGPADLLQNSLRTVGAYSAAPRPGAVGSRTAALEDAGLVAVNDGRQGDGHGHHHEHHRRRRQHQVPLHPRPTSEPPRLPATSRTLRKIQVRGNKSCDAGKDKWEGTGHETGAEGQVGRNRT